MTKDSNWIGPVTITALTGSLIELSLVNGPGEPIRITTTDEYIIPRQMINWHAGKTRLAVWFDPDDPQASLRLEVYNPFEHGIMFTGTMEITPEGRELLERLMTGEVTPEGRELFERLIRSSDG